MPLVPSSVPSASNRSASRYKTAGTDAEATLARNAGDSAMSPVKEGTPPTTPSPMIFIAVFTVAASTTQEKPTSRTCHSAAMTAVRALNRPRSNPPS